MDVPYELFKCWLSWEWLGVRVRGGAGCSAASDCRASNPEAATRLMLVGLSMCVQRGACAIRRAAAMVGCQQAVIKCSSTV